MCFDKRQTNIAKGVSVLMLLWHHLFYDTPEQYSLFSSLYLVHGIPIECFIARLCNVCVAIFLFLSGFGLYKSWQSKLMHSVQTNNRKSIVKHSLFFSINHLKNLLMSYWFIYVVFVPIGVFFGRKFWEIYNLNVFYGLSDVLGFAFLFNTPTMNETWWFMSVIILLYLFFPVLLRILNWSGEILLIISIILMVFPYFSGISFLGKYFVYIPPFVLGMLFAQRNGFEFIALQNKFKFQRVLLCGLLIVLFGYIRWISIDSLFFDSLFALAIIMFSFLVLSQINVLNSVFEFLGKHSGFIFMFHTFIYNYYFKRIIYAFKYSVVIFIVMVVSCCFISVLLNYIKQWIHFNKIVVKCK